MITRGTRVLALNSYSGRWEIGTVVDVDQVHGKKMVLVYFDEFGQLLDCFFDDEVRAIDE